jgi:hypothetical protein
LNPYVEHFEKILAEYPSQIRKEQHIKKYLNTTENANYEDSNIITAHTPKML